MKVNGNEIRQGHVIRHHGKMFVVIDSTHVKPGKGGAYVQVQMRGLEDSSNITERFRSSQVVDRLQGRQQKYQYLYGDDQTMTIMDGETYEQSTLPKALAGEAVRFLQDGMEVELQYYDDVPVSLALPKHVIFKVLEADPVVKGQTAAASYKSAILEGGIRVQVPPFVKIGQRIVISTEQGNYVRRADG